jgi:predicted P-loop ATPase
MVRDAMTKVSKEHAIDSARDYIAGLTWDGVARLDTWLCSTYGVANDEYHKKVGANWLKGLVKRIVEAGCKFDYVLVLEGEQGVKKSTSLHVLGGAWHAETTMSTDTKDFFMQFAGKAIIEFSEGETLSRTEVKRMKAIITMQSDRYRMPYERATLDFPRRCVFAMTTNQTEYLKDETGNRRWLPVKVVLPEADIEWLRANREQLFAEAYHRVHNLKETLYEFPKEEMERAQNERMVHDANEDLVASWYYNELRIEEREAGITIKKVYDECLHRSMPMKPMSKYDEMQIAFIFSRIGLTKKREMVGGARATRYFPKEMSTPSEYEAIKKQEQDRLF